MKRLPTICSVLILCIAFTSDCGYSQESLRGIPSRTYVHPKVIPSILDLAAAEESSAARTRPRRESRYPLSQYTDAEIDSMKKLPMPPFQGPGTLTIDPSSAISPEPLAPSLGVNFEGTTQDSYFPGDVMVAVGPDHVVSVGNTTIRIQNKTGTVLLSTRAFMFFGVGDNLFDCKVLYDIQRDRFVMLYDYLTNTGVSRYYVAVSQTSSAMGGWYQYFFDMKIDGGDSLTSNWADFPGLGIDDNALYMTGNMYTFPANSFQYVKTRVVDKKAMYDGIPVAYVDFIGAPGTGIFEFTLKPVLSLSPTTTEYLIINANTGPALALYKITGAPATPVMTKVTQYSVTSYGIPPDAPQKFCPDPINTNDARTHDPVWRDGFLHAVNCVGMNIDGNNVCAVRYYKINTNTNTLVTDETFGAGTLYYYYPAVTVDVAGTAYFSFGRSNSGEFASAWYSGKRKSDAGIQASSLLKSGSSPYDCGSISRWGDYFGISLDPSETASTQSAAWPIGMRAKGSLTWGSWIGKTTFFYHRVQGTVLDDCDGDTTTTGDRVPVSLVTVTLHIDTTTVATTTTDSSGNYSFGYLEDSVYNVRITLPAGATALDALPGSGGLSETKINGTHLQVSVTGMAVASQTSSDNNFVIGTAHPIPATTSLAQAKKTVGDPGFTMTIYGSDFMPCSIVRLDGSDRVTTYVSSTQLHALILASDMDTVGTYEIAVFTQGPGGGTSNSQTFFVNEPVAGFSITPSKFSFGNEFVGVPKTDSIIVSNPGTGPVFISMVASDNSDFGVSPTSDSIPRDSSRTFYLTFTPSATGPRTGNVIFTHNATGSPDTVIVNGNGLDSTTYRTAKYEDWAMAVDAKGKRKAIKRKPDKVFFKFSLDVPTAPQLNHVLELTFAIPIKDLTIYSSKVKDSVIAFSATPVDGDKRKKWRFDFNPTPPQPGSEIQIDGQGLKGKIPKPKYKWLNKSATEKISGSVPDGSSRIDDQQLGLPKPNLHNVGEELFPKGFGQPSPIFSATAPLPVGIPKGEKGASSVRIVKYSNIVKSLLDQKSGLKHVQASKCLNRFITGDSIKSQQSSLPPTKQNNKLFGELLALKLNVAASATGKFPIGLGELMFDDPSSPSNPFNGQMVNEILRKADTLVSCLTLTSKGPAPPLDSLYNVLRKINAAFADSVDTISFSTKTRLTGTKRIGEVLFLHKVPGVAPVIIASPSIASGETPLTYNLYQNYPNPFNPVTVIGFQLPVSSLVSLKIYNVLGQEVATLLDRELLDEGEQEVEFEA
ncbi:MAG: hypothetical protein HY707_02290, partial [Ignavibacteriae bacterium]|nr:hypothetical protein [Ignavibacteriota bacterium]